MVSARTFVALGLAVVGLLTATVGADVVEAPGVPLWLAVGGSLLAFGAPLAIDEDDLKRGMSDERFTAIYRRAGYVSWYLGMAVAVTLMLSVDYYAGPLDAQHPLMAVVLVLVVSFVVAINYYERTM